MSSAQLGTPSSSNSESFREEVAEEDTRREVEEEADTPVEAVEEVGDMALAQERALVSV